MCYNYVHGKCIEPCPKDWYHGKETEAMALEKMLSMTELSIKLPQPPQSPQPPQPDRHSQLAEAQRLEAQVRGRPRWRARSPHPSRKSPTPQCGHPVVTPLPCLCGS